MHYCIIIPITLSNFTVVRRCNDNVAFLLHLRSRLSRIHSAHHIIFRTALLGDLVSFNFRAGQVRENQTGVKINGNMVSTVGPRLPRKFKGYFVTLLLYMIVLRTKISVMP